MSRRKKGAIIIAAVLVILIGITAFIIAWRHIKSEKTNVPKTDAGGISSEVLETGSQEAKYAEAASPEAEIKATGDDSEEKETKDAYPFTLSADALYALQYILSVPLEKLYSFRVVDEVQQELERFMQSYLGRFLPHKFKSLEFIL